MSERCSVCEELGRAAPLSGGPEFSVEPDDGNEVLSCKEHLAELLLMLFDRRLAAGQVTVYDVRPW